MAQLKNLLVTGAARFLNEIYGDLNGNVLNYGECTTAEATNTKTVTTNGVFELKPGSEVAVKFTNGNSANSLTLNVNDLGAKNVYMGTSVAPAAAIQKGYTYLFKYDGTNWQILGPSIAIRLGTDEIGSTTQPIYIQSGGIATPTSYALKATVNNGTATRVAYYSGANAISSGSATSDGSYFGNVAYLSVNEAHQTSYRLKVNGTSFFNGDMTLGSSGTRAIKYQGTKQTYSMIRFLDNTADTYGNGISIGGGGTVIIGAGESATNFSNTPSQEVLYLLSDGAINIEANGDTIANRIGGQITTAGNFIPIKAEANNNNAQSIGVSGNRWKAVFIGTADSYGSTAKGVYWNNGVPAPMTYSLNASLSSGTADRIAWYNGTNIVSSGNIVTDGNYLSNATYVTINEANQSTYRLKVNGTSYFSGIGTFVSTTEATSTSTGSLIVSGGVGIAKNIYIGNNLFANTSGNEVSNIKYYTGESNAGKTYIGWIKFASLDLNTSNQFGNQQFDIFLSRTYNSPSSEVYGININVGWGNCNIIQTSGSIGTQIITNFRVVKNNTNHKVYFEYYVNPSYTTYQNTVNFKIIKYHGTNLILLNEVQTEEDTSFANIWEISLVNGISTPKVGTKNKIAYYSGTNTIDSGSIDTDGSYLRNVGGYNNTSYAFSADSAIINSWIRTVNDTGWYSQTHGGGWYMNDNNYIRMYANKQVAINSTHATSANNLSSQLIVGSVGYDGTDAAGNNVAIELWRGTNASWQIINSGGNLLFKNNYTTARQTTYSQTSITLDYNTGAGSIPYLAIGQTNRNTTYKLYVNGTSYFNGNTTHNGIIYFANGTTYFINNSAKGYLSDLFVDKVRLENNWIGFYSAVNSTGTRYGYISADANYMIFRKENSNNGFNFNGNLLSTSTNTYDLGTSSQLWRNIYTRRINQAITGLASTAAVTSSPYKPMIWSANAGVTPANGDIITIKTPAGGHDYGVFLSVNNGTNYYPIALSGNGRMTTHYPSGTYLTLIFDSSLTTNSVFPMAGSASRVNQTGGAWRVINYYDSGNPGDWNLRQYTIKAAAAIRAGHAIGALDETGYKEIDSGSAFDIRYAVLYAGSAISSGSTGNNNFIHHYSVNIKNSGNSNISLTTYKNVYIKGTLNGTVFTPISGGNPYVLDIPATDDGYSYYYMGRAYNGSAMTFDTTGQKIYDYRNAKTQIRAGNVIQDLTSTTVGTAPNINAATFDGKTRQQWLNDIYPVGSIYMSVNSTNPATLFGGTWQAISGQFLIGANTTYTAGSSGGSATHTHTTANHTLTVAEIPSHQHAITKQVDNNSGNSINVGSGSSSLFYKTDNTTLTIATGGGSAHNHGNTGSASTLPPYLAVYIWKRTA